MTTTPTSKPMYANTECPHKQALQHYINKALWNGCNKIIFNDATITVRTPRSLRGRTYSKRIVSKTTFTPPQCAQRPLEDTFPGLLQAKRRFVDFQLLAYERHPHKDDVYMMFIRFIIEGKPKLDTFGLCHWSMTTKRFTVEPNSLRAYNIKLQECLLLFNYKLQKQ